MDAEGDELVVYRSGNTVINVYRSDYAGTNQATAVTWTVGRDVDEVVRNLKAKGVAFEHYDMPGMTQRGRHARRGRHESRLVQGSGRQYPEYRQPIVAPPPPGGRYARILAANPESQEIYRVEVARSSCIGTSARRLALGQRRAPARGTLQHRAARAACGEPCRRAAGHEKPLPRRPLGVRLRDNERSLLAAYRAIAAAVGEGRAITPAAEWLLDNYHLVDEQIREIREDLPPGYYRQLPKLADGPFAGYPRVFGLAWAFVAHNDSRFDPEALRRFVRAYQQVQPLTIGELWAVAITLRIVLVENLRRAAQRIVSSRAAREEADAVADRLLGVNGQTAEPDALFESRARPGAALLAHSRCSSCSGCGIRIRA